MNDDALTRNGQGELAVRTVSTSGDNYVDKNDVYTRDNDGKLCIRTVGNGGGGGGVTSVNGKTGDVVLDAEDVNAIPQLTELPEASADLVGKIVQYVGTDVSEGGEYFTDCFYKCYTNGEDYWWDICKVQSDFQNIPQFNEINSLVPDENDWMRLNYSTTCYGMIFQYSGQDIDEAPITGNIISYSETISDVQLDVDTFVAYETPFTHPTDSIAPYLFDYYDGVWSVSGVSLKLSDLTNFGITYTGTPSDGDSIEVQITSGSAAYKSGYFYQVTSDVVTAKCTIAQTTGATLSDLAIDTDVLWAADIALTRGLYNFEYLGASNWQAPDESIIPQIALQDIYGITFSGTPSVGDVITITTIVPWKELYVYNQINVQPTLTVPDTMPTLVAADWSSNTQTISVTGVTANNIVFVSPAPSSAAEYAQCGIICTAQATDSLTFTCTATPTNDLTVNVVIM